MKYLIFIDNDQGDIPVGQEGLQTVKDRLKDWFKLPEIYVDTIKPYFDFSNMDREEAYKLCFSSGSIICTYSMYTATHYGSIRQLTRFLQTAGISRVKGVTYLDTSGMMLKALSRELESGNLIKSEYFLDVLRAIQNNYIITLNEEYVACRMLVAIDGYEDGCFNLIPTDTVQHLKNLG